MGNQNCGCESSPHKSYQLPQTQPLSDCGGCVPTNAECVTYSGVPLQNLGVTSNSNLEYILQEIDAHIPEGAQGVWDYDYSCLDDEIQIINQKQFVEEISRRFCILNLSHTELSNQVGPLLDLSGRVLALEQPEYTSSAFIGITPTDGSEVITDKLADAIDNLNSRLGLSAVDWDANYTVITNPTTLPGGFNEILRQIGLLKTEVSNSTGIGTFDTTASCLPTKSNNTPLTTVISELIEADCSNAKFEYPLVTWGCVTAPIEDTFQDSFQRVVDVLGALVEEKPVFDQNQFDVTPLTNCEGYSVTIKEDILNSDGKVFVKDSSLDKHFLSEVFIEGDNVTLDITDDTITINSNNPNEGKVAVDNASTPDYLGNIIVGGSYAGLITINPVINGSGQIEINPTINEELFTDMILNTIQSNPILMNKLCNLVCGCQNTCS